jgi:hypothetical protein
MRMHNLQWLVVAGLVAGSVKAYQSREEIGHWIRRHQFQVDGLERALPSQVYFIETNRWLNFDIPGDTSMVRLISNASVSTTNQAPSGAEWPYAIDYQVCDGKGRSLASGIYHFQCRQLVFVDKHSGKTVEVNSYLDRGITPLGGRRWMLNLSADPALTNAQVLKVRLHSSHPDLLEIAARVYFQRRVPERKLAYRWNRLSDDQKRDLARGNVYSIEGLTAQEKEGLLRFHWLVAAPEGIPGRDFRRRILYIRDDSESLKVLKDWMPAGISVDQHHRAVLPVTNSAGHCQFQLVNYEVASTQQVVSSTLVWHGEPGQPPETSQLTWSGASPGVIPPAREGLLEISASRRAFVRAFQVEPGSTREITPEPINLQTYAVSPTNSLEFTVNHAGHLPVLFRADVRRPALFATNSTMPDSSVGYELLAVDGNILKAGEMTLTNDFSPYDWLVTSNGLADISEPQSLCFVLPATVRKLRIFSPRETLLVNSYSRPFGLPKRVRVPEDYSPVGRMAPNQPSWFTLRPLDYFQRRETGQTALVRLQQRPLDEDSLIQAGQYEWDSFLPENEPTGRLILIPARNGASSRPDSLSFTYAPVGVGHEQIVRFEGLPWEREVAPSLILISTNTPSGSATVSIDGRTILTRRLDTPVSALRLGNQAVGEHTLSVSADSPVSAHANFTGSATNASYLQRFCVETSSNSLQFRYVKRLAGTESLVLRVYSPLSAAPQPFKVWLRLKPSVPADPGPFPEVTLLEREAWVTPGSLGNTWLVAATPAQLDDGRPLYFPVGTDVPPGEHQLEVIINAPSPRWLSLSRTTPGIAERLEITSTRAAY